MEEPKSEENVRADLKKCPPWVVAMLRDERLARIEHEAKARETEAKLRDLEEQMKELTEERDRLNEVVGKWEGQNAQLTDELRKRSELVEMLERKLSLKENIIAKKDDMLHKVKDFVKEVQLLKENLNVQMQERLSERDKQLRLKREQSDRVRAELLRLSEGLRHSLKQAAQAQMSTTLTPALQQELKARETMFGDASADFSRASRQSWRMNRDIKVFDELVSSGFSSDQVAMKIDAATIDENHALELKQCMLTELPARVTELIFLGKLDVSNNKLATIPAEISQLRLLVVLNLSNNCLTELPGVALKDLVQLRMLNLSQNKLKALPEQLGALPMLEVLDASHNQIETIPASLGELSSLEAVNLSHNAIEHLPEDISGLSSLEELFLSSNQLRELPSSIGALSNLMVVDVSNNKLESLPEELHQLANTLNEIKIDGNPLPTQVTLMASKGVVHLLSFLRSQANPDPASLSKAKEEVPQGPSDVSSFIMARGATITPEEEERVARQTRRGTVVHTNRRALLGHKAIPPRLIGMTDNFTIEHCDESIKFVYGNDNLVNQEFNTFSDYRNFFVGQPHANFVGVEEGSPLTVSVLKKPTTDDKGQQSYRVLIRTKDGDERHWIPAKTIRELTGRSTYATPRKLLKALQEMGLVTGKLRELDNIASETQFAQLEDKLVMRAFKFGVLLLKDGQTDEDEMFANESGSQDYEDFLKFLGDKIQLEGWTQYNGGLDVKRNATGTHSIFCTSNGFPIMLHVSTMLPHSATDKQQLERKRHLGNDVVVIVFAEGTTPFLPNAIHSEFNHVFAVFRVEKKEGDRVWYRLEIATKAGCLECLPALPDPPVFRADNAFRHFLYTKLINAERAAYFAPGFSKAILRTRHKLLENLEREVFPDKKSTKNKEVSQLLGKFKTIDKMGKGLDTAISSKSVSMIVT